jgi:hypothetical protein
MGIAHLDAIAVRRQSTEEASRRTRLVIRDCRPVGIRRVPILFVALKQLEHQP